MSAQRQPNPYIGTIVGFGVFAGLAWIAAGTLLFTQLDNLTPHGLAMFISMLATTGTILAAHAWSTGRAEIRKSVAVEQVGGFYQAERAAVTQVIRSAPVRIPIDGSIDGDTRQIPRQADDLGMADVVEIYKLGRRAERSGTHSNT